MAVCFPEHLHPEIDVTDDSNEFLEEAGRDESTGLIGEFRQFMRENAKW